MPRHTHPRAIRKHPRAQLRHQRRRYIERRWARVASGEHINKCEQSVWYRHDFYLSRWGRRELSPEEQQIADLIGQVGPIVYVHPDEARHLPRELQAIVGDYADSVDRWLKILPRRLSYRGANYHDGWGWGRPLRVTKALDFRGKQRLRREIEEELSALYSSFYDWAETWELVGVWYRDADDRYFQFHLSQECEQDEAEQRSHWKGIGYGL